jgi:putative Holliday junction resolvase
VKPRTRVLAVDPGAVRVGLAISDPDRRIASPLTTYTRRDQEQDSRFLNKVIGDEEAGLLLVGLPVHLDGREGVQAQKARAFGTWLQLVSGLPVVYWDERFSTVEAENALWDAGLTHKQRKARRDALAAQILLQSYLDAGCTAETKPLPLDDDKDRTNGQA